MNCGPANVAVTASLTGPVSNGTNLTLQCSADDPTESGLTYKWLHNGYQIRGEFSSTLMLSVTGLEEGGTYTCNVSNRVGQGEAIVTVEVIGKVHGLTLVFVYACVCVCACVHKAEYSVHTHMHTYLRGQLLQ